MEALDSHLAQLERAVAQSREKLKEEEARICEMRAKNTQEDDNSVSFMHLFDRLYHSFNRRNGIWYLNDMF